MASISGFYEQLGVDAQASAGQIRAAYGQSVAKLVRRRKALVEQGGDTASLDLARAQLDEAWAVLSDPVRRRRARDRALHRDHRLVRRSGRRPVHRKGFPAGRARGRRRGRGPDAPPPRRAPSSSPRRSRPPGAQRPPCPRAGP